MSSKENLFTKNKLNIKNATSSEFGSSKVSVVGLMSEWVKDGKLMKGATHASTKKKKRKKKKRSY